MPVCRRVAGAKCLCKRAKVGMQASRCMCRQAGARTGRQVPMHEGRCPMHEGRCPCMWAGARAGRQVPVQAGRCPHRGAGAWCCTGEWYILFKTPSQVLYKNTSPGCGDHFSLYRFTGPGKVAWGSWHTCVGVVGGCWRVLAGAGGRGQQWRTRRTSDGARRTPTEPGGR